MSKPRFTVGQLVYKVESIPRFMKLCETCNVPVSRLEFVIEKRSVTGVMVNEDDDEPDTYLYKFSSNTGYSTPWDGEYGVFSSIKDAEKFRKERQAFFDKTIKGIRAKEGVKECNTKTSKTKK
jgi:hypothetical protein